MFISRSFLTTQCNSFSIYLICVCVENARPIIVYNTVLFDPETTDHG